MFQLITIVPTKCENGGRSPDNGGDHVVVPEGLMMRDALCTYSPVNPNERQKSNLLLNLLRPLRGELCQAQQHITHCNDEHRPGSTAHYIG